jgi:hypothetical protein
MSEERPMSIPEKLGFASKKEDQDADRERVEPYSQLSYQARYLLYEDEAQEMVDNYPTHRQIDTALGMRYATDREYHERINGGYPAMEAKMRAAGLISQEEQDMVDWLNASESEAEAQQRKGVPASLRDPDKPYPEVEGFSTPRSILSEAGMAAFMQPSRRLIQALGTPEKVDELVDATLEDDQFYQWLDDCIARGDHKLHSRSAHFHLNDVPERERRAIYRMLANRYLEWKHLG